MKKIILLISYILICPFIKAQDIPDDFDGNVLIDAPETDPYIDWGDPVYESLYNSVSSSNLKSTESGFMVHPGVIKFNQADSRWGNNAIATDCNTCYNQTTNKAYGVIVNGAATTRCAISSIGCAITCQAMVLATFGYPKDPGTWNTYLTESSHNGFVGCGLNFWNNNIFQYSYSTANSYLSKQYIVKYAGASDDDKVAKILKSVIDIGGLAIIKINRLGKMDGSVVTRSSHFVLIYGYYNSNPALKDFILSDPGTAYDDDKTLTLEYYYDPALLGQSPLIISTDANPTIRFYASTNLLNASSYGFTLAKTSYTTGESLSVTMPTQNLKSTSSITQLWTLKTPKGNSESSSSSSYSFTFYKPGKYILALTTYDGASIYSDEKSVTVTGDTLATPWECGYAYGWKSRLEVTKSSISIHGTHDDCSYNCFTEAVQIVGPGYINQEYGYDYAFNNLPSNTEYKIYHGWYDCNLFWYCYYNHWFQGCLLHVVTTPYIINEPSDISANGSCNDIAFTSIDLTPGFYYKPSSTSDLYTASTTQGKQSWVTETWNTSGLGPKSTEKRESPSDTLRTKLALQNNSASDKYDKIFAYPNPTTGLLYINIDEVTDFNVSIYSVVTLMRIYKNANVIDLSDLPSGIYFVNVKTKYFEKNFKIVKE